MATLHLLPCCAVATLSHIAKLQVDNTKWYKTDAPPYSPLGASLQQRSRLGSSAALQRVSGKTQKAGCTRPDSE